MAALRNRPGDPHIPFGCGLSDNPSALIRRTGLLPVVTWNGLQLGHILQINKGRLRQLRWLLGPEVHQGKTGQMQHQREYQQVQKPLLDILV